MAETIDGLFEAGVIHRRGPWRSFEAVAFATLEWVDGFNTRRLLEPIGTIPPAEARDHAQTEVQTLAARPKPTGRRETRRDSVVRHFEHLTKLPITGSSPSARDGAEGVL